MRTNNTLINGFKYKYQLEGALKKYKKLNNHSKLKGRVCNYLLRELKVTSTEDLIRHITEINTYGLASGVVGEMIYYYDTIKFYDRYSDDIMNTMDIYSLQQFKEEYCYSRYIEEDLENFKNKWAWIAFEDVVREIEGFLEDDVYNV